MKKLRQHLFAKEKVDGFFLEYDDERSGDFKPLEHIPDEGARSCTWCSYFQNMGS